MSLLGGHKRCALQQVLNAQDWSELWGCVQKHGGLGDALSTTRVQGAYAQEDYLAGSVDYLFNSPIVSMFLFSSNVAITHT